MKTNKLTEGHKHKNSEETVKRIASHLLETEIVVKTFPLLKGPQGFICECCPNITRVKMPVLYCFQKTEEGSNVFQFIPWSKHYQTTKPKKDIMRKLQTDNSQWAQFVLKPKQTLAIWILAILNG